MPNNANAPIQRKTAAREETQLSPSLSKIVSALKQLDLPELLLLQGITAQLSRAKIHADAKPPGGSNAATQLHALFAEAEDVVHPSLSLPRGRAPFMQREDRTALAKSPAIGAAIARGHADLNALLSSEEFISLSEAAKRCGVSEQTIRSRVKSGKLFGVAGPGGIRSKYPAWQFSEAWGDGVFAELLQAMPSRSGLDLYRFFITPSTHLAAPSGAGVPSPLDILGIDRFNAAKTNVITFDHPSLQSVLALARAFGAEGAAPA